MKPSYATALTILSGSWQNYASAGIRAYEADITLSIPDETLSALKLILDPTGPRASL